MGLFEFEKKEKQPDRFIRKDGQSMSLGLSCADISVIVDTRTGMNYIMACTLEGGVHVSPLLGADGKPVVDKIGESSEDISVELS